MNRMRQFLYKFSTNFMMYGTLLLGLLFFVCSFLFTSYSKDMQSQQMITAIDHPLWNILGIALSLGGFLLIRKWASHNPDTRNRVLLYLVMGWYLIGGILLILFGRTAPAADAYSVYSCAEQLSLGNPGVIHPTDSYLSYYPQQVGLMGYYELFFRIWHLLPIDLQGYHVLKVFNIFWAQLIILFQYKSIRVLFKNPGAETIYLLISLLNLPLLIYTSFVYGELPSLALFSIGAWAVLRLLHCSDNSKCKTALAFLSILSFVCSVALRKNTLIPIIAVVIVTCLEGICRKGYKLIILSAIIALVSVLTLPCIEGYYEKRTGSTLSTGVPAISYLAMGMQEGGRSAGWYNGFNFNTYRDTGMDTAQTATISKAAISERIDLLCSDIGYTLSFYGRKFSSQWCDGTYASLQATWADYGGRTAFFTELYEGRYTSIFNALCNILQNLIYLGILAFGLTTYRNRHKQQEPLYLYLFVIAALGGLLFHMIWEANSRYILPYGLLLIPYAAQGMAYLSEFLNSRIQTFLNRINQ